MTLIRNPDSGLLQRAPNGLLTRDTSCCCGELSCLDCCISGTSFTLLEVEITNMAAEWCSNCEDINDQHQLGVECVPNVYYNPVTMQDEILGCGYVVEELLLFPPCTRSGWTNGLSLALNFVFNSYNGNVANGGLADTVEGYALLTLASDPSPGYDPENWLWNWEVYSQTTHPFDCVSIFNSKNWFNRPADLVEYGNEEWCDHEADVRLSVSFS